MKSNLTKEEKIRNMLAKTDFQFRAIRTIGKVSTENLSNSGSVLLCNSLLECQFDLSYAFLMLPLRRSSFALCNLPSSLFSSIFVVRLFFTPFPMTFFTMKTSAHINWWFSCLSPFIRTGKCTSKRRTFWWVSHFSSFPQPSCSLRRFSSSLH